MHNPQITDVAAMSDEERRALYLTQMRLVPGAVAIIATAAGDDQTGMAATAWNSLCADPPTMLVCVNAKASAHDIIAAAGSFSINMLSVEDTETVAIFSGQRGLSGKDRFLQGQWHDGPSGQPMLTNALASFECALVDGHRYGTHTIFIGTVEAMHSQSESPALLYTAGQYGSVQPLA